MGGTTNQRGTICYNQKTGWRPYRGRQATPADVPSGEKATKSFVTCDHTTPTHLPRVGNGYPGPCKQSTSRHRLAGPPQNCYHKAAGNQNAVAKPETTASASNALKTGCCNSPPAQIYNQVGDINSPRKAFLIFHLRGLFPMDKTLADRRPQIILRQHQVLPRQIQLLGNNLRRQTIIRAKPAVPSPHHKHIPPRNPLGEF